MTLDPDSPEMGVWVDRWLTTLRQDGACDAQLQNMAERLARAFDGRENDIELVTLFERFVDSNRQ